ncbi:hypothetical protein VST7929_01499 [Vibrio stylophorae]|uniref:Yip1 domain-containing protein n=1 Tax=Vibrio stylophorae TaxID=659351 RepID=A0ABN8DTG4_9VIBR|nr:hypothetical protein [Vibrio stylophorae]CAH0533628.1 hypothetical protein VST7929_01499 [Vibrio stylophorae]
MTPRLWWAMLTRPVSTIRQWEQGEFVDTATGKAAFSQGAQGESSARFLACLLGGLFGLVITAPLFINPLVQANLLKIALQSFAFAAFLGVLLVAWLYFAGYFLALSGRRFGYAVSAAKMRFALAWSLPLLITLAALMLLYMANPWLRYSIFPTMLGYFTVVAVLAWIVHLVRLVGWSFHAKGLQGWLKTTAAVLVMTLATTAVLMAITWLSLDWILGV